jgi:hypothetical protein
MRHGAAKVVKGCDLGVDGRALGQVDAIDFGDKEAFKRVGER